MKKQVHSKRNSPVPKERIKINKNKLVVKKSQFMNGSKFDDSQVIAQSREPVKVTDHNISNTFHQKPTDKQIKSPKIRAMSKTNPPKLNFNSPKSKNYQGSISSTTNTSYKPKKRYSFSKLYKNKKAQKVITANKETLANLSFSPNLPPTPEKKSVDRDVQYSPITKSRQVQIDSGDILSESGKVHEKDDHHLSEIKDIQAALESSNEEVAKDNASKASGENSTKVTNHLRLIVEKPPRDKEPKSPMLPKTADLNRENTGGTSSMGRTPSPEDVKSSGRNDSIHNPNVMKNLLKTETNSSALQLLSPVGSSSQFKKNARKPSENDINSPSLLEGASIGGLSSEKGTAHFVTTRRISNVTNDSPDINKEMEL